MRWPPRSRMWGFRCWRLTAAWLRLAGLNTPVVVMGNTQADFVDHMQRSGVAHVVPYPADVMVFSRQVVDAANAAPASPGQTPPVAWR